MSPNLFVQLFMTLCTVDQLLPEVHGVPFQLRTQRIAHNLESLRVPHLRERSELRWGGRSSNAVTVRALRTHNLFAAVLLPGYRIRHPRYPTLTRSLCSLVKMGHPEIGCRYD